MATAAMACFTICIILSSLVLFPSAFARPRHSRPVTGSGQYGHDFRLRARRHRTDGISRDDLRTGPFGPRGLVEHETVAGPFRGDEKTVADLEGFVDQVVEGLWGLVCARYAEFDA